jgi:hypothetical protein
MAHLVVTGAACAPRFAGRASRPSARAAPEHPPAVAWPPRLARAAGRRRRAAEGGPWPARPPRIRRARLSHPWDLHWGPRDVASGAGTGRWHGVAPLALPGEETAPRGGQRVGAGRPAAADSEGTAPDRPSANGRGPPAGKAPPAWDDGRGRPPPSCPRSARTGQRPGLRGAARPAEGAGKRRRVAATTAAAPPRARRPVSRARVPPAS